MIGTMYIKNCPKCEVPNYFEDEYGQRLEKNAKEVSCYQCNHHFNMVEGSVIAAPARGRYYLLRVYRDGRVDRVGNTSMFLSDVKRTIDVWYPVGYVSPKTDRKFTKEDLDKAIKDIDSGKLFYSPEHMWAVGKDGVYKVEE